MLRIVWHYIRRCAVELDEEKKNNRTLSFICQTNANYRSLMLVCVECVGLFFFSFLNLDLLHLLPFHKYAACVAIKHLLVFRL